MKGMIRLRIDYYASLRERRGLEGEDVRTAQTSLRGLYAELAARHAFPLNADQIRPAVNDTFCDWERALVDGDRVVFVPPMGGG